MCLQAWAGRVSSGNKIAPMSERAGKTFTVSYWIHVRICLRFHTESEEEEEKVTKSESQVEFEQEVARAKKAIFCLVHVLIINM